MTEEEFDLCLQRGAEVVSDIHASTGCNIISFGEMGSGNTSSSSMWMHLFTGIPLNSVSAQAPGSTLKAYAINSMFFRVQLPIIPATDL